MKGRGQRHDAENRRVSSRTDAQVFRNQPDPSNPDRPGGRRGSGYRVPVGLGIFRSRHRVCERAEGRRSGAGLCSGREFSYLEINLIILGIIFY